jgi:glyoxylate reductase
MKPSTIFINTSRGEIIDQKALYETLQENKIFGAGIDVTNPDRLDQDHELFNCNNLIITPHIGGADSYSR